jgi:hypothetical protein
MLGKEEAWNTASELDASCHWLTCAHTPVGDKNSSIFLSF